MSKLYRVVSASFVEADDEDDALARLAARSWDDTASVECREACPRCRAVLDDCVCYLSPAPSDTGAGQ